MNTSMASTPLMEANQKATFAEATVSNVLTTELTSATILDLRAHPEINIDFNAVLVPTYVSHNLFVNHIYKGPDIVKGSESVPYKRFRIRNDC